MHVLTALIEPELDSEGYALRVSRSLLQSSLHILIYLPSRKRKKKKKKKDTYTQMEVKLWNDKREREMYDNFAELYAIIKATEKLEKAYVRDIISPTEYETECQKLIAHFKTLSSTLKDTVPSIERFADTYKMDCPAAINRLVTSGVPATVEHRAASAASATTSAAIVAECVQNFITAMDSLKLNMVAVDQVHPLLSDLSASLNKLSILPSDFEGKTKMKEWILRLSKMGAADELTEQQARQLHFDLESSYNSFMAALPSAGT
ncbi:hypothetical protein Tsubulata_032932 [Turnera subulata]|uniref:Vacuolar protein sorting-associated protein 28 homolog n=1 Tax=Turnera subulata TaxID=218843 RepID=A0A9Q0FLV5_9ROSI|nr:hypothetical protein Tsubulata_032932 [Turnera subulata]